MTPHPVDINVNRAERTLRVMFDDGSDFTFSAEFLRVESPSAEVKGHSPAQRKYIGGKAGVGIADIEPVGNYAIRIVFDDGHDSGFYSWSYLYELGQTHDALWRTYLAKIAEAGLHR